VYYCIIGGGQSDEIVSLVLDKFGSVFVGGTTNSSISKGFPITANAPDTSLGTAEDYDGFVAQFTNEGSHLEFCTYIGGEFAESIQKIIYNEETSAIYAVGSTKDNNTLPSRINSAKGGGDAFYQAISIPEKRVLFSGYFGGTENDNATSLAIYDKKIYLVGYTSSMDIPNITNSSRGNLEGFIATLNQTTGQLLTCQYYGGNGNDKINGIWIDTTGKISICGTTNSVDLPIAVSSLATSPIGDDDGFIAQFSKLDSLIFTSYIGSTYNDELFDIKADAYGQIYVIGNTKGEITAPIVPKDADISRPFGGVSSDCFWAMINPKDTSLDYATYLGGSNGDFARAIAIFQNHIYCAGFTSSVDFRPIANGFSPNFKGGLFDGFFCIQDLPIHPPTISPKFIDFGKVLANSGSKRDSIMIKNNTSRPISFKIPPPLVKPPFSLKPSSNNFTLNPLEYTVVYVDFTPLSSGTSATLFALSYETGGAVEMQLKGEGILPSILINPSVVDFGEVELDSLVIKKMVITNKGTAAGNIHFLPFQINSPFEYVSKLPPKDTILKIDERIEISIVFRPKSEGITTEEFTIEHNGIQLKSTLVGEGIAPHFRWNTDYLNFPNTRIGRVVTLTATVKNTGKAIGNLASIQLIGKSDFSIIPFNKDSIVKPGDSIQCRVKFAPTTRGALLLDTLIANTESGSIILPVFGRGMYPVIEQLSPPTFKYGDISLGLAKIDTIVIANHGDDIDTLFTSHLTSPDIEKSFMVFSKPIGTILMPEDQLKVIVMFSPKSIGAKTNTVAIHLGKTIIKTELYGNGVSPQFYLPSTIRFGKTEVGTTSQLTVYLKNIGTDSGFIGKINIVSDPDANFTIDSTATPQNKWLASNDSSPIVIKFSPKTLGVISGCSLEIKDAAKVLTADLRGESVGTRYSSPMQFIDYGLTEINSTKDSFIVIHNTGNENGVPIISALQNNSEGNFVKITSTDTVKQNDSLKIHYRFTPRSPGNKTAFFTVSGGAVTKPYTISLYGTGSSSVTYALLVMSDTLTARTGDKISIPLILRKIDGKKKDSVRSVRCLVRYNSSVLGLEYPLSANCLATGDSAVLSLWKTTNTVKTGDTILSLDFTVGLGNSPSTEIIVESIEWRDNRDSLLDIATIIPKSRVLVTDIAEINGKLRLYEKGQMPSMTIKVNTLQKNPLQIHLEGAAYCTSLIIYDERGRIVADISHLLSSSKTDIEFENSALAKGMYFCVLRAGNTSVVKDFVVQ
jgi:hypothetical protein